MDYRTALITGASSGMGRSVAKRLAREGTTVVLCARRVPELEALAKEIRKDGGSARIVAMDVADTERLMAIAPGVPARASRLEIFAGGASTRPRVV